jgi:23S rRNA (guanosine2251-2'-O)-methyltransferase
MHRQKKTMEELDRISSSDFKKLSRNPLILVLDNVRSAHNVGSVFRTGDAFLIEKLYLCGITPQPPNNEIHKTALGATESVEWEYAENTESLIKSFKAHGFMTIAVEQTHQSVPLHEFKADADRKTVLIFGHEVYGIDQKVINLCDASLEIPQMGTKHSLNVSVCAGIVIYHILFKTN